MVSTRQSLIHASTYQLRMFFNKHTTHKGFNPRLEHNARKKAGIKDSYYYCWDCAERIKKENKIESFGKKK